MKTCYLVGAGDFDAELPRAEAGDMIIAADGGYDALKAAGREPDLLIGDLDSIAAVPEKTREPVMRFPTRKDETDMFLAYREGARRGYTRFRIYGGTGGRADHSFANYCLLLHIREAGGDAALVDREMTTRVIKNERITLAGTAGKRLSIFAFGGTARGVTILGASYEAEAVELTPDTALGVSNEFVGAPVTVEVTEGALLIMQET